MTKQEEQMIKLLRRSPQWQALENFATEYCDKVAYESVVRDSEWETLKTALVNDGKIQGIKVFLQEITKIALNEQN